MGRLARRTLNTILSPCSGVCYRTRWQCGDLSDTWWTQQGQRSPGAGSSWTNPGLLKQKLLENVCGNQMGPRPRRAPTRAARSGSNTEFSQKACFSSLLKLGPPAHSPEQGRSSRGQEEQHGARPQHVGPAQSALSHREEARYQHPCPPYHHPPAPPSPANSYHRHPGPLPTH